MFYHFLFRLCWRTSLVANSVNQQGSVRFAHNHRRLPASQEISNPASHFQLFFAIAEIKMTSKSLK